MKRISSVLLSGLAIGLLFLCISQKGYSQKSYVDTLYHKADYEDIQRLAKPLPVKVEVHFQRNGQPLPAADNVLRGNVERELRASGVFTPTAEANTPSTISVTGNNIADLKAARSKGFKAGFTFGAAGSMVDDNYEFLCVYNDGSGEDHKFTYPHAIHTAVGRKKPQTTLKPTTVDDAFNHVVQDVILNFIKDIQDAGLVPKQ